MDFNCIDTPALVVGGAKDDPHFTPRGPEWHAAPFYDAPGADALLMINGVGNGLGGIAGWRFEGQLLGETIQGSQCAVIPTVKGTAKVISYPKWLLDETDPVGLGFTTT
ncbi:proline racemase family protein [Sulfitobacter sp. R18_1]|uniref:proline racemase family protein n=1 Tax=Sulfitobacter sp. R18_1 TaxID=2821104 RepID=UPI001ADD429D|nr:proline racemase family protein [Sulfitobacter sp. R18_1]